MVGGKGPLRGQVAVKDPPLAVHRRHLQDLRLARIRGGGLEVQSDGVRYAKGHGFKIGGSRTGGCDLCTRLLGGLSPAYRLGSRRSPSPFSEEVRAEEGPGAGGFSQVFHTPCLCLGTMRWKSVLGLAVLLLASLALAQALTLDLRPYLVKVVEGKEVYEANPLAVRPGDVLEWRLVAENRAQGDLRQVALVIPIPKETYYLEGSAKPLQVGGTIVPPEFSFDGGRPSAGLPSRSGFGWWKTERRWRRRWRSSPRSTPTRAGSSPSFPRGTR